jgi:prevent-host-death family protein
MQPVNIHEAKTLLSRLVEEAARGEAFIIAKAGKPLVKVVPLDATDIGTQRRLGFMRPDAPSQLGRSPSFRLPEGVLGLGSAAGEGHDDANGTIAFARDGIGMGVLPFGCGYGFGSTGFSLGRPPSSMSKPGSNAVSPCGPRKAG